MLMSKISIFLFILIIRVNSISFFANPEPNEYHDDPFFNQLLSLIRENINAISNTELKDIFNDHFFSINTILEGVNLGDVIQQMLSGKATDKSCNLCKTGINLAKGLFQSADALKSTGHSACENFHAYSKGVCDGLINRMAEPIYYMLKNTKLTPSEVCATLVNIDCMKYYKENVTWNLKYDLPLPAKTSDKTLPIGDEKRYRMLHITDIHVDPYYTPGSNVLCNEPMCCSATSSGTSNISAGYWSDTRGNCDSNMAFVIKTLEHIKAQHEHEIDFIIWTGDTVPHDVWNTTREENTHLLKTITDLFKKTFPNKKVFPVFGNHEAHPVNMFSPPEVPSKFSMSWLYDSTADIWKQWIDTNESQSTFRYGGYYALMVSPKLKLIGLNNNVCGRDNFWNALNPVDPGNQLLWLIKELDKSEKDGHYVMIIGHIPPTGGCLKGWVYNYIRIIERYQHLIVAQYHGHTHNDEIGIIFSNNGTIGSKQIPVSVSYIGPSITTYSYLNAAYRIFTLNGNGMPLNYQTYYTKISEDNHKGINYDPEWQLEYSTKESYQMESLTPQSWNDFMEKLNNDEHLLNLYFNHYHRFSKDFIEKKGNNKKVKLDIISGYKAINPFN